MESSRSQSDGPNPTTLNTTILPINSEQNQSSQPTSESVTETQNNPPLPTPSSDTRPQPMIDSPSSPRTENSTNTFNQDTNQGEAKPESEAMEVDSDNSEPPVEMTSLSVELGLDNLWMTLSECLVELGETPDTHAVLVLQPTVEAFFLVHASAASGDKRQRTTTTTESRETQLAHLHHDIAPLSPLPSIPDGM